MRKDVDHMKCRAMWDSWLKVMLAAGLALLLAGLVWVFGIGVSEGLTARMAGFLSGLGGSLTAIGGGVLLMNRLSGEARTRQRMLHMEDERGLTVAYKAQSAAAIAAVLALVVILVAALVRGDSFYMLLGTAACFLVALTKLVAWCVYDRTM